MAIELHPLIANNVRDEIVIRLRAVEKTQDVRIVMAVESGSRAWGFPSRDSDYDVRFLYVHRRDRYLSLAPPRNVIEQPIVDEIDLNGWDVRKALGLMMKSNGTISEWIAPPIRYRPDDPAVAELEWFADSVLDPAALARHYVGVGQAAGRRWLAGAEPVPVKRYVYALRPAIAVRHLRMNPHQRPPIDMPTLLGATELPRPLLDQIDELIRLKARTNEAAKIARRPDLDALIRDELANAKTVLPAKIPVGAAAAADAFFARLVDRLSAT